MEDKISTPVYVDNTVSVTLAEMRSQCRIMIVLYIVSVSITQSTGVMRYIRHLGISYHTPINVFTFFVYPWLFLTNLVLGFIGLMNYTRAVREQQSSVANYDQQTFTGSFYFYKRSNKFHIAGTALGLISSAIFLLDELMNHSV
jgi:hypothetical protein